MRQTTAMVIAHAAVIRMESVGERSNVKGMHTNKSATTVSQPINPTGTPFSILLRLLIFKERITDQMHKRTAHEIMSNEVMIIMTATNSSNSVILLFISFVYEFFFLLATISMSVMALSSI